eukprot:15441702-Alexandrium_andersonii.AAC.1
MWPSPISERESRVLLLCEFKVPFEFEASPCAKCKTASRARAWSCAGPGTASNLIAEAPDGCAPRRCSRWFEIRRRKGAALGPPV